MNIYIDPFEGEYEEKADVILVSHNHFDHCDDSKILKISKSDSLIVGPSDVSLRIPNVKVLQSGDNIEVGNVIIEAVKAYNYKRFRSPGIPYHPKDSGIGYLISVKGKTIYNAGDTDFIPEMSKLKKIYLALLPIGGTFTMDIADTFEAIKVIRPKIVLPMHRRDSNPQELKEKVEELSNTRVIILKEGEKLNIE